MYRLVTCLLLAIPARHCTIVSMEFLRPCGQMAGIVSQSAYANVVTRSRLECARTCAVNSSCVAFTACGTSPGYDCGLLDTLSPALDCAALAVTRENCSFQVKYSTDVQPIEYISAAETNLSAECPEGAYPLPHYHVCYWAHATSENASDFQHFTACQDDGGQLAIIPSESVMVSLESLMDADTSFRTSDGFWLDIDDRETEDTFVTQLGPAPWLRWRPEQPNDAGDPIYDQDCIALFPGDSYLLQDKPCIEEHIPLCYHHQTGDGFRHVFTSDGTSEFGNVTSLRQAIEHGNDVRVMIHSWDTDVDLVVNIDYVEIMNADLIFALSVHNMEMTGTSTRVILTASTAGQLTVTRWESGTSSNTTRKALMSWYATDKQKTVVFQSATSTEPLLTSAIMNGSDIRLHTARASYALHDVYYGRDVVGQFVWVPRVTGTTWKCTMLNQDVHMFNIYWNTGLHNMTEDLVGFKLLAGDPWKLVFSNDGSGSRLYGWVTDLIRYIHSGHRVKVIYDGRSAEVDTIYIKSGTVFAMLTLALDLDGVDASTNSWFRTVTLVSTAGTVRTYSFAPNSATFLSTIRTNATVHWYVDVAVWTEVHRSLVDNTDTYSGSVTLNDVFDAGQPIRIRLEIPTPGITKTLLADNVAHDTSSGIFTADLSHDFVIAFDPVDGSIELGMHVVHCYNQITSSGSVTMSTVPNGQYTSSSYSLTANAFWFSQPYLF